jgi:hypothetical protein
LAADDTEDACFSMELPAKPTQLWEAAALHRLRPTVQHDGLDAHITAMAEGCWRLGAALYFEATWRWRVAHFDETNDVSVSRHTLFFSFQNAYNVAPNSISQCVELRGGWPRTWSIIIEYWGEGSTPNVSASPLVMLLRLEK